MQCSVLCSTIDWILELKNGQSLNDERKQIILASLKKLRYAKRKPTKAKRCTKFLNIMLIALTHCFMQSNYMMGYLNEMRFYLSLAQSRSLSDTDKKFSFKNAMIYRVSEW